MFISQMLMSLDLNSKTNFGSLFVMNCRLKNHSFDLVLLLQIIYNYRIMYLKI